MLKVGILMYSYAKLLQIYAKSNTKGAKHVLKIHQTALKMRTQAYIGANFPLDFGILCDALRLESASQRGLGGKPDFDVSLVF